MALFEAMALGAAPPLAPTDTHAMTELYNWASICRVAKVTTAALSGQAYATSQNRPPGPSGLVTMTRLPICKAALAPESKFPACIRVSMPLPSLFHVVSDTFHVLCCCLRFILRRVGIPVLSLLNVKTTALRFTRRWCAESKKKVEDEKKINRLKNKKRGS